MKFFLLLWLALVALGKTPVEVVMFSDFQCPYCSVGYKTVEGLKEKYGDKIVVVYKNLPLAFHPMAMPAAQYYEAIVLQDPKKADAFKAELYSGKGELAQQGEAFLKASAKKVKADMKKLAKDIKSKAVAKKIEKDGAQAKKLGFTGTPSFTVAGEKVMGAQPKESFEAIIDKKLKDL